MVALADVAKYSIGEVDRLFSYKRIAEDVLTEYIRRWNQGPHFSQAVFVDGRIRLFDPEKQGVLYKHLFDQFGVRA